MTNLPTQRSGTGMSSPWWNLRAEWIYEAILAGDLRDHGTDGDVHYPVMLEYGGEIELPTGQLVAADPYLAALGDPEPFTRHLPPGTLAAIAARAVIGPGHDRVAALLLRASDETIVEWEMGCIRGQNPSTLEPDTYFGYGVDSGTGAFGDPEAMRFAGEILAADEGMLEDPISKALLGERIGTRSAAVVAPTPTATPIVVCSSGWGDGSYPTWLGLDSEGQVAVAITDFLLTSDPYAAPPPTAPGTPAAEPSPKPSLLARLFRR